MALKVEKLLSFGQSLIHLQSFPVFLLYLALVSLAGVWQRISSPLNLRMVLVVYNVFCSVTSLYTFVGLVYGLHQSEHVFEKEPVECLKPYLFMYWVTKNVELMDTVFMVLRHRKRQLSFLHVYHHGSMLLLSDYGYHYSPWPAIALFLCINSLVHVLLYMYYGLTAWKPSDTPVWKQRLTEIQILQFLIDFVFASIGYIHHGFCVYGLMYGILMTGLFSNFYYFAYIRKRPSNKKTD